MHLSKNFSSLECTQSFKEYFFKKFSRFFYIAVKLLEYTFDGILKKNNELWNFSKSF